MSIRRFAWVEDGGKLAFKGSYAECCRFYNRNRRRGDLTLIYAYSAEDREKKIATLKSAA